MKNSNRSVVLDESPATRKALVAFAAGAMSCRNWRTLPSIALPQCRCHGPAGVHSAAERDCQCHPRFGHRVAFASSTESPVVCVGQMTLLARCATLCLLVICFALSGCTGGKDERSYGVAIHGDPHHGKDLIVAFGCGACHIIPGIHNAQGLVGPPLSLFAERTMIAGEIANEPDNLVRWIENPQAVEPKTAMPDLGLSHAQAVDIAAYLYTLR